MHAPGLEPGAFGEAPQDQKRAGPSECTPLGVQEELRPVAAVEVRASVGEVAAQRVGSVTTERHDSLLVALAQAPGETLLEVDVGLGEANRLADPKAATVEELDQRAVTER